MLVQGLIPLFLVAHVPLEDGVSPAYGLEYIFAVNMNITWTRENINPFGSRVLSRLHCTPKRNESKHVLSCSLRHRERTNFGRNKWDDGLVNRRKDVTDKPIELVFNQEGIEEIIVSQQVKMYDLNILKLVAEHLHTGNDFNDVSYGKFKGKAWSTIGTCNVTFEITHRPGVTIRNRGNFELHLRPPSLHLTPGEMIIIDKTTHLDNCTCYARNYYRKYGNTIVCEDQQADLVSEDLGMIYLDVIDTESMTSRMKISETSFVSSTIRKGMILHKFEMYNVEETTMVTLEDVRFATADPPAIVNPGKTKIVANYGVQNLER